MTPAQNSAFQAATGHTAGSVSTLIASIVAVLVFMWAAWIVMRVLSARTRGEGHDMDLVWAGLRASALIWIALYVLR